MILSDIDKILIAASKPINTAIEKISAAIGILYEPKRIVKKAEAVAEVKMIEAKTTIALSDLENRALARSIKQETYRLKNIETIISKALPLLGDDAMPEKIENDWLIHLFNKCEDISDEDMQTLWAKLLAGELNSPGNYSKRTINFISLMSKDEAKIFTEFCRYVIQFDDKDIKPVIFLDKDFFKNRYLVTYENLLKLSSIGLFSTSSQFGYKHDISPELNDFYISYYGTKVHFKFQKENDPNHHFLSTGDAIFTPLGKELYSLCSTTPVDNFIDFLISNNNNSGYKIVAERT